MLNGAAMQLRIIKLYQTFSGTARLTSLLAKTARSRPKIGYFYIAQRAEISQNLGKSRIHFEVLTVRRFPRISDNRDLSIDEIPADIRTT